MLTSYSRTRPKSAIRISFDGIRLPANTGLRLSIQKKHSTDFQTKGANKKLNSQIITKKSTFPITSMPIKFKPPISIRKTTLFEFRKPSYEERNGQKPLSALNSFSREQKKKLEEDPQGKIFTKNYGENIKSLYRYIRNPLPDAFRILGRKLEVDKRSREEKSKTKYTIETPKCSVNISSRPTIQVVHKTCPDKNEEEEDNVNFVRLNSKYYNTEATTRVRAAETTIKPFKNKKKKKRKLKKHKAHQTIR